MLDYLFIAAHPDDAEIGAGGTIALLKSQGQAVGILDLTDGEPTPHGTRELRRQETDAATAVLGVDWRENLGLPNRSLEPTLAARHQLATVLRRVRPRVLFAPYWEDSHPDHVAASALVDAARFWAKLTKTDLPGAPHYPERIYYYFSLHLRLHARPAFVVDTSDHIETKMRALACYQSQFVQGRSPVVESPVVERSPDRSTIEPRVERSGDRSTTERDRSTTENNRTPRTVIESFRDRARYWGWSIGAAYGEPFVCREEVGLRSLRDLL